MKIIFYGGCHAAALRRVFEKYGIGVTKVAHLTNYSLIRAGKPVPYDDFLKFDAAVYSPIRNKADYNTDRLVDHLDAAGRQRVSFPWLQWEGYHPGVKSVSEYAWYSGWWPQALESAARSHDSFSAFRDAVAEGHVLADIVQENAANATERFHAREDDCDVRVASHIDQNFRKARLFLTPDHASTTLYKYIVPQIADRIGVRLDPAFHEMSDEIQAGIRLPILSSVRKALDLEFTGGEFENKLILRSDLLNQSEYLRLIYDAADVVVARSNRPTRVYQGEDKYSVPQGSVVFLTRNPQSNRPGFASCTYLAGSRAPAELNGLRHKDIDLYRPHWTFGRSLKALDHDGENTAIA